MFIHLTLFVHSSNLVTNNIELGLMKQAKRFVMNLMLALLMPRKMMFAKRRTPNNRKLRKKPLCRKETECARKQLVVSKLMQRKIMIAKRTKNLSRTLGTNRYHVHSSRLVTNNLTIMHAKKKRERTCQLGQRSSSSAR